MWPTTRMYRLMAIVTMALVSALVVCSAHSEAAEAAKAAEAAPAEASALTPEEHYAKGEALYNDKWMPLAKVLAEYRRTRDQLRQIKSYGTDSQGELEKLHRELAQLRGEARKEEQPVRRELGGARTKLREYNSILRRNPPAKPTLQRYPSQPRRPTTSYDNNSSSRSYSSRSSGSSGWYEKARRDWQRQCDQIKRQNELKMQQYQRALQDYNTKKNEAKAGVPKVEATIKECMAKLGELESEYEDKGAPTMRQSEHATERVRSHNRRVEVIETRLEGLTKALRAVPEPIRFKHDIIDFEKEFHTTAELDGILRRDQAQIDRLRDKLQADCEKAGIPFPENWQHPQQARLDQIKVLIEAAKKAQAGKA